MAAGKTGNTRKKSAGARGSSAGSRGKRRSPAAGTARKQKAPENGGIQFSAEAAVIFFFALALLLFLSNFGLCGAAGAFLKRVQTGLFGSMGYLFPILTVAEGVYGIANRDNTRALMKIPAAFFLMIAAGAMLHLFGGTEEDAASGAAALFEAGRGGGLLGGSLCGFLKSSFGTIGAFLILAVLIILLAVAITERSFVGLVRQGSGRAYRRARDDFDTYREELRERAARRLEQRALEEAQQKKNIDFASTDLSMDAEMLPEDPDIAEEKVIPVFADTEDDTELPRQDEALPEMSEAPAGAPAPIPVRGLSEAAPIPVAGLSEPVRVPYDDRGLPDAAAEETPEIPEERDERIEERREIELEDPALMEAFRKADEALKRGRAEQRAAVKPAPAVTVQPVMTVHPAVSVQPAMTVQPAVSVVPAAPQEPAPSVMPMEETQAAAPVYGTAPSTVSFAQEDGEDAYSDFRSSASADFDDGNPWTDDEEPVMPTAEEIASAGKALKEQASGGEKRSGTYGDSTDPAARTIVTASGKVIRSDYEVVQQRMDTLRAESEAGEVRAAAEEAAAAAEAMPEYRYPPVDLLEQGKVNPLAGSAEEYRQTAERLQQTLHSFGVDVTVTNISCGPVVTRYELLPAQGVKVSRIVGLSDDIKLSLAAADIRIEAPVPGKSVVGIEVPNKENNTVYLRDLFESPQFQESRAKLAFAVGKDIGGQTVVTDISKMPHLLIAGATGSGKSVCINTLIMSILYKYDPKDVKLIMVDPKVVELSVYNGIPHLLIPVVTDPKKAAGALNWAVSEMTDRYKKYEKTGVRNLKGYNDKILEARKSGTVPPEELPQLLPQIVIIIDELADLMMVAKGEVEESICRLAQLARAAGLHLVIATQRPSVNVITGLIKANIPSRIAFAVSSGVDSRTILDSYGAEKLLGKGDMLFSPQGAPRPMRVQGAFVSDSDVQKVVDFIRDEGLPLAYSKETAEQMFRGTESSPQAGGSGRDELFANAGRFIIERKKASIGNLQRMFKIGFNRAARIMDQLSEAGVVGEEQGTKPREILMTAEQFEELVRGTQ